MMDFHFLEGVVLYEKWAVAAETKVRLGVVPTNILIAGKDEPERWVAWTMEISRLVGPSLWSRTEIFQQLLNG